MQKIMDDKLASMIRSGEITPEEALEKLRADEVLVYEGSTLDPAKSDWADVEDDGVRSGIHHALRSAGATDDLLNEVSVEVARLRAAGSTVESLWA